MHYLHTYFGPLIPCVNPASDSASASHSLGFKVDSTHSYTSIAVPGNTVLKPLEAVNIFPVFA